MIRPYGVLVAFVVALGIAERVQADIIVGPYTFDDLAFADVATQLDAGTLNFSSAAVTDLSDALTGFSPGKGLFNIGNQTAANDFRLEFTDLIAVNAPGPDLVFFEAFFGRSDPYEIAVRTAGGSESPFRTLEPGDFVTVGLTGPSGSSVVAAEIELDDFGLSPGTAVDAVRFRALENLAGLIEGDPVMAAVLNVPEPSSALLIAFGLAALRAIRRP